MLLHRASIVLLKSADLATSFKSVSCQVFLNIRFNVRASVTSVLSGISFSLELDNNNGRSMEDVVEGPVPIGFVRARADTHLATAEYKKVRFVTMATCAKFCAFEKDCVGFSYCYWGISYLTCKMHKLGPQDSATAVPFEDTKNYVAFIQDKYA